MEDRIEINGTWYVREDIVSQTVEPKIDVDKDLTFTESCIYENDDYAFEVSRIRKGNENSEFYDDCSIEFTDKRSGDRDTWIRDYWDSTNWMIGVLDNNPESLAHLKESVCPEGEEIVKLLLMKLAEMKWLNLYKKHKNGNE
jgi:hypothetical protein